MGATVFSMFQALQNQHCGAFRIDETFTWYQQEYVEISEECGSETIHREIKQQVPAGRYQVVVRDWQNDQVVNRVIKEFIITRP